MNPSDPLHRVPARPGASIRDARRARIRMIRSRVIGVSVALFLVVWSLIAVRLVTGHDPALARQRTTAAATSGTSSTSGASGTSGTTPTSATTGSGGSTSSSSSTSSPATSSSTGGSSAASSGASTSSVSPVTSAQS